MTNNDIVGRITSVLSDSNSVSICLPNNPTYDSVAASIALHDALKKLGKSVSLSCSSNIDSNYGILGQDKIQSKLVSDGDDLVVSFPYVEGSIDKVTYNIEDESFNLVIQPGENGERLNPDQVSFSYTGGSVDAIVTIYAPTLNSLGALYTGNKEKFSGVNLINIDRHFTNANFGSINYVDKKSSSMSEMVLDVVKQLGVELDKEIASNIYAGIAAATNNFTAHSVNANTFETIAMLMRHGAVKKPAGSQFGKKPAPFGSPMGVPMRNPAGNAMNSQFGSSFGRPRPQARPQGQPIPQMAPQRPIPQSPLSQPEAQPQREQVEPMKSEFQPMQEVPLEQPEPEKSIEPDPAQEEEAIQQAREEIVSVGGPEMDPQFIENKELKQPTKSQDDEAEDEQTPQDWLKPKIFKGANKK